MKTKVMFSNRGRLKELILFHRFLLHWCRLEVLTFVVTFLGLKFKVNKNSIRITGMRSTEIEDMNAFPNSYDFLKLRMEKHLVTTINKERSVEG